MTYEILIRLTDGSKILLPNVTEYNWDSAKGCLKVVINGYWQMFNLNSVMYVGRTFDLGEAVYNFKASE